MSELRRVAVAIPGGGYRRWHERLVERLSRDEALQLSQRIFAKEAPWPESVATLLMLEKLLLRHSRPTLCDAALAEAADGRPLAAEIVIDLVGDVALRHGERLLRPLYDGEASDHVAIAALLSGRPPVIEILDVGANVVIAAGLPSLEDADGLTGGLEAVYSRVIALLQQSLTRPSSESVPLRSAERPKARSPSSFFLRGIAYGVARRLYHLCCLSPHWRVGWRFNDGPGVIETASTNGPAWRYLTDRNVSFSADPFPCKFGDQQGIFYERFDYRVGKGAIYFQRFDEDGQVGEPTPALEESWHLSYPFLTMYNGQLYMVPEASASGAITLYRCARFPDRWEPVAHLVEGVEAADATIFHHEGRYWMTCVTRDGIGGYSDVLELYYADGLLAPWSAHESRPAIVDSRFARPAGSVIRQNGELLRPVQDCSEGYGRRLVLMRIDKLTPAAFRQSVARHVVQTARWPGTRLHTINRCGRLECIDGIIIAPKPLAMRRYATRIAETRANRSTKHEDEATYAPLPDSAADI